MKFVEATIIMPLTILLVMGLVTFSTDSLFELSQNVEAHKKEAVKLYESSETKLIRTRFKLGELAE